MRLELRFGAGLEVWTPGDEEARAAPLREVVLDPVDVDEPDRPAHRVENRDRSLHEMPVAVLVEPVESRACRTGTVEARHADDDDLIGSIENSSRRGLEDAGSRVEADEVVVPLEELDDMM